MQKAMSAFLRSGRSDRQKLGQTRVRFRPGAAIELILARRAANDPMVLPRFNERLSLVILGSDSEDVVYFPYPRVIQKDTT